MHLELILESLFLPFPTNTCLITRGKGLKHALDGGHIMFLVYEVVSSDERIRFIDKVSNGFIYMVSSFSITGAVNSFGKNQIDYFKRINKMNLKSKLLIGFGISNKNTFNDAVTYSKGAIIGSAFIKFLKTNKIQNIKSFIDQIRG